MNPGEATPQGRGGEYGVGLRHPGHAWRGLNLPPPSPDIFYITHYTFTTTPPPSPETVSCLPSGGFQLFFGIRLP